MHPAGIVLAAGGSSRMGRLKALLPVDGRPLITAHCEALAPHCSEILVVVGAHGDAVAEALPAGVRALHNPDWEHTHIRESLGLALAALAAEPPSALPAEQTPGSPPLALLRRVVITPVDAPPATDAVLTAILAGGGPAVPEHDGRDGHPVVGLLGPLVTALAAGTLRDALADAPRVPVDDPDVLRNLNHPADWRAWRGVAP